jgi:methanogenic corrinoid protein MtbC1
VQRRQYQAAGPLPTALPQGADAPGEEATRQFQAAALRGDAAALVAQLAGMRLRGYPLSELFDEVATPALHDVGEQWTKANLSVAEEHVASQAVIEAVARSQPLAEPPGEPVRADRGTAIVAAVAGELHDIAARMAACLLRAQGFEVLAPLAQTPARDLADLILRARGAIVALSSTVSAEVAEQVGMAVTATRQTGGRVIVGGEGMRKARLPPEAKLLASMRELDAEAHDAGRRRARTS